MDRCHVVISGSRDWYDKDLQTKMLDILKLLPSHAVIIHGNCRGVDKTADRLAKELNLTVKPCLADWKMYGKKAVEKCNTEMLDQADIVYAFHQDIESSKGTKDMINQAKARGTPVILIT